MTVQRDSTLGTHLLRSVSRSFYLSLRLLPHGFREPISLAYLLARLSDTLADTAAVGVQVRLERLREFRRLVRGDAGFEGFFEGVKRDFEEHQTHRGERELVLRAKECLDWLARLTEQEQRLVREVMHPIIRGQELDLERFSEVTEGKIRSLQRADELDQYTYLVAGCVGEFWTEVGFAAMSDFSTATKEQMRIWGKRYGQGLQLVNILRDLPEDLAAGRCYLPHLSGEVSAEAKEQLLAKVRLWSQQARGYLADGLKYTAQVKGTRLRMATGLPALLGMRTLEKIEQSGWAELEQRVKVTRHEVRHFLLESIVSSLHPRGWQDLAELLGNEREAKNANKGELE